MVACGGHVFRYRGDTIPPVAEAEAHARAVGVPDAQIDWP